MLKRAKPVACPKCKQLTEWTTCRGRKVEGKWEWADDKWEPHLLQRDLDLNGDRESSWHYVDICQNCGCAVT